MVLVSFSRGGPFQEGRVSPVCPEKLRVAHQEFAACRLVPNQGNKTFHDLGYRFFQYNFFPNQVDITNEVDLANTRVSFCLPTEEAKIIANLFGKNKDTVVQLVLRKKQQSETVKL